jgi:hypothetical protein
MGRKSVRIRFILYQVANTTVPIREHWELDCDKMRRLKEQERDAKLYLPLIS